MNDQRILSKWRLLAMAMSVALLGVMLGCGNTNTEQAAEETTEEATTEVFDTQTPVGEGKEWFLSYCTMCHGEDGSGGGILVDSLRVPPPDLRTIALRRGEFSAELMAKIIAGEENVPGHSTGDMPAWFETFKESERITDEAVLQEKIDHIVAYLATIQLTEVPVEE